MSDIYSVPIEGGDITRVTHDNKPHWGLDITPDGENFVYGGGDIFVQPVSGGPATRLYEGCQTLCNPDVSPDGTHVAFGLVENGMWAVYTVPFSTTEVGTPTKVPGSEAYPDGYQSVAYSPDGQHIAYDLRAATSVIPVGGGDPIAFVWGESNPQTQVAWAPASSDTTAPQFGPLPDITAEATGPRGAAVTFSVTVTDHVDPNPMRRCTRVIRTPFPRIEFVGSGATFPIGTTRVACTTEDAAGNRATDSFDVTVRDTTAPAITGMPSDIVAEAIGANGTQVSWSQPTATDLVSGSRTVNCTPASGTTFALGETTVSCTATDTRNNTATKTFKVTVQDTTAPDISDVPDDIRVTATSSSGREVDHSLPTATDLVDGSVPVECSPASGTTFALATTTVYCTAQDAAGNKATGSFDVSVVYDWSGVLQPINADGSSIFKLGSIVPVKFALSGDSGSISDATAKLTFRKIDDGIEGTVMEATSTTAATTGNLFRYDAASGQYVFNWSTKGLESGPSTYKLSIDLGDGTVEDPQTKNHVVISLKQ